MYSLRTCAQFAIFASAVALAQTPPLPDLKVEATDGGSAVTVRNTHPGGAALTCYLIELVDYPGSSFAFWQDELVTGAEPLAAGKQRRIPILNMTVGAAPDYVRMTAALYSDGSAAGPAEKVAQLRARRKLLHDMIREVLATSPDTAKLQAMISAIPIPNSKLNRAAPEVVDRMSRRALLEDALMLLAKGQLTANFKARDVALAKASRP